TASPGPPSVSWRRHRRLPLLGRARARAAGAATGVVVAGGCPLLRFGPSGSAREPGPSRALRRTEGDLETPCSTDGGAATSRRGCDPSVASSGAPASQPTT